MRLREGEKPLAKRDRGVWAAYGWPADETPADIKEDVILSRMLALNEERA